MVERDQMESQGLLVGSSHFSFSPPIPSSSDLESIRKRSILASHFLKQGWPCKSQEDDQRSTKIPRSISLSSSSNGEQMLSFSSSKPSSLVHSLDKTSASSTQVRSSGLNCGDLNVKMQGGGVFTLSQRMELKHQMLIFNYIWANIPIPTNLLCSIMRGLSPAWLSASSSGTLIRPNAAWWGYLLPGYAGNADPEPGRCRRTDGKKWRCSRDAVPDQKYCERHINRGRHRSRKPVEGHGGHAKRTTPSISNPASIPSVGQSSSSLTTAKAASNASSSQFWMPAHGDCANDSQKNVRDHSTLTSLFPSAKSYSFVGETASNTLMSHLGSSFSAHGCNFVRPIEPQNTDNNQPQILSHFLDDWQHPQSQAECSNFLWPGTTEEVQSERRVHLSVPFHPASPDFSPSTSSPNPERFSPLHMGLGLIGIPKPSASMGGPLGEALTSGSASAAVSENRNFLSLINEGWDLTPRLTSSTSNAMQSATVSSASSGSASDAKVEKNSSDSLSCLFGPNSVNSLKFPPFVSI